MISKVKSIISGWSNYIVSDKKNKALYNYRVKQCSECVEAVEGTYEKLMPDYTLKKIKGLKCNICKCPLSTKIRSLEENCPLTKW